MCKKESSTEVSCHLVVTSYLDYYLSEKKVSRAVSADYILSLQTSFSRTNRKDIRYMHLLHAL